ncbi:MAG TPA: hypothetical protein VE593_06775 [Nitrososphaeraceae archaeon]|jgi:hypothetical protein|nr:hypothetical protein [Nitrososphaeraceae archaeon]HYZ50572.1 hypothetical protein [Nitrososphaeraceae archaeon]
MTQDMISSHFEKARAMLKSEHDLMIQKIKEEIYQSKQKTLSKI